jgi:hypothetical protein
VPELRRSALRPRRPVRLLTEAFKRWGCKGAPLHLRANMDAFYEAFATGFAAAKRAFGRSTRKYLRTKAP